MDGAIIIFTNFHGLEALALGQVGDRVFNIGAVRLEREITGLDHATTDNPL